MGQVLLNEGAAQATPAAGKVTVYAKTDGKVYVKDDTGTETLLNNTASVSGTTTNDDAVAGDVGEYVESISITTNAPTSNQYGDLANISLTAGDWDLSAIAAGYLNGATCTLMLAGIGTATGNNSAGLAYGDTQTTSLATSAVNAAMSIPAKRVTLSGTTTYYLKMYATYSAGTPQFIGRISARRVR